MDRGPEPDGGRPSEGRTNLLQTLQAPGPQPCNPPSPQARSSKTIRRKTHGDQFQCELCPYSSDKKVNLRIHYRVMHQRRVSLEKVGMSLYQKRQ